VRCSALSDVRLVGGVILTGVSTDEIVPGIVRPDSAAAYASVEVAAAYCSPALVNHCIRSYVWAASYASRNAITFDAELLYVASMLHDIGLMAAFDSHTMPFEDAGGHVAWVFAAGAGWPAERRTRAAEIIVAHMRGTELEDDVEGYLLALATSLDISGRHPEWWPADFRDAVVGLYPRLTLREEFLRCFEDQAARKPESSAASAMRNGIAGRLMANVLDHPDPGART
jgi:hypothetical protein